MHLPKAAACGLLALGLTSCSSGPNGAVGVQSPTQGASVGANVQSTARARPTSVNGAACSSQATDPNGMPVITLAQLPPQATDTLKLIARHGPFPFSEDDTVFDNYQKLLPIEPYGYYHEFTVLTPDDGNRGTRRVVTGADGGDYYTPDHYTSFEWISCGGH
jgi:ribonuclease T1